jgi:hypothetical protein
VFSHLLTKTGDPSQFCEDKQKSTLPYSLSEQQMQWFNKDGCSETHHHPRLKKNHYLPITQWKMEAESDSGSRGSWGPKAAEAFSFESLYQVQLTGRFSGVDWLAWWSGSLPSCLEHQNQVLTPLPGRCPGVIGWLVLVPCCPSYKRKPDFTTGWGEGKLCINLKKEGLVHKLDYRVRKPWTAANLVSHTGRNRNA